MKFFKFLITWKIILDRLAYNFHWSSWTHLQHYASWIASQNFIWTFIFCFTFWKFIYFKLILKPKVEMFAGLRHSFAKKDLWAKSAGRILQVLLICLAKFPVRKQQPVYYLSAVLLRPTQNYKHATTICLCPENCGSFYRQTYKTCVFQVCLSI